MALPRALPYAVLVFLPPSTRISLQIHAKKQFFVNLEWFIPDPDPTFQVIQYTSLYLDQLKSV